MIRIMLLVPTSEAVGPVRQLSYLAKEIDRSAFEISVVSLYGPDRTVEGVPILSLGGKHSFDLSLLSKLRTYIRNHNIDILHSRLIGANFWGAVLYSSGVIRHHVLNVTNSLALSFKANHGVTRGKLLFWIYRRIINKCSIITTNSSHLTKELLTDFRIHREVRTIFNAVYPRPHRSADRKTMVLGSVSRIVWNKHIPDIIRSVGPILRKRKNVILRIFGDGPDLPICRSLVSKEFNDVQARIEFAGYVDKIAGPVSGLYLLINASESEGQANSILEALAAGVPVVTSAYPGVEDLVQDGSNGMTFPVGDIDGCRQALEKLLGNFTLRRAFSKRAQEFSRERLSPRRQAKEYERIYRYLPNASRGSDDIDS